MARTRVPVVEGWFAMPPDDVPIRRRVGATDYPLIGGAAPAAARASSRRSGSCPAPRFADGARGGPAADRTLWSYTGEVPAARAAVPATDPYEPVCLAAVELERERMVVLGQVVAGVTVDDLRVGMEMELVLDTLNVDDEHEYVVWKWRPAEGSA